MLQEILGVILFTIIGMYWVAVIVTFIDDDNQRKWRTKMNKWISAKDRLPEEYTPVLVYTAYDENDILYAGRDECNNLMWYNAINKDIETIETYPDNVLAWMPLPEPYKGE